MPRIEIKSIPAGQEVIFRNVLNYVAKDDRCFQGYIGASKLCMPAERKEIVDNIQKQIQQLRVFYGKTDKRLGLHCIIAFSKEEMEYLTPWKVLEIGYYISETEFAECMTYFAVHDHTELLHLDMLVIPIKVCTGKMYGCPRAGWSGIELRLREYLLDNMPESAVGGFQTAFEKYRISDEYNDRKD